MLSKEDRLNLGSGGSTREGWINLDCHPFPGVNCVHKLDIFNPRLPFPDNHFVEVYTSHFLEHLFNRLGILEEIWRVCKPKARVQIKVPRAPHPDSFRDPTHYSFWNEEVLDYLDPTQPLGRGFGFYSKAKFRILEKQVSTSEVQWILEALK